MTEQTEPKMAELKNGTTEVMSLVTIVMAVLHKLMEEKGIVVYELVMKCRDRNHKIFGSCAEDLKSRQLMESDENVHSSIRNIVLSSAEGEGLDMVLTSPLKK